MTDPTPPLAQPLAPPSAADRVGEATARITDLEAELEASGTTTREGEALARVRTLLHEWVDTVTAVVATPGVGRVVLIHANGAESRIASPELPFRLAVPVTFGKGGAGEGASTGSG